MNILIEHKVRPIRFELNASLPQIGAGAVDMTLFDPGERKLHRIVAALSKASFGCHDITASADTPGEG